MHTCTHTHTHTHTLTHHTPQQQQELAAAANTAIGAVNRDTAAQPGGEEPKEGEVEEGGVQGPKGHNLIRRKSYLPTDYETVMALQHYNPVDNVLTTSDES